MSMILNKCAIPKGSLYHYFKSKKEMVLAVIKERLSPRMDEFYALEHIDNEHEINTIINSILKVTQKEELIMYGCPLNRLNRVTNLELYDSLKLSHVISTLALIREAVSENDNIQLDRVVDFLDGFEEEVNYFLAY